MRHVVYGADFPATPDASLRSEASWNQKLIPVSPSYSILFVPQYMGDPVQKNWLHLSDVILSGAVLCFTLL